jgi:hypothetical protein
MTHVTVLVEGIQAWLKNMNFKSVDDTKKS